MAIRLADMSFSYLKRAPRILNDGVKVSESTAVKAADELIEPKSKKGFFAGIYNQFKVWARGRMEKKDIIKAVIEFDSQTRAFLRVETRNKGVLERIWMNIRKSEDFSKEGFKIHDSNLSYGRLGSQPKSYPLESNRYIAKLSIHKPDSHEIQPAYTLVGHSPTGERVVSHWRSLIGTLEKFTIGDPKTNKIIAQFSDGIAELHENGNKIVFNTRTDVVKVIRNNEDIVYQTKVEKENFQRQEAGILRAKAIRLFNEATETVKRSLMESKAEVSTKGKGKVKGKTEGKGLNIDMAA